MSGRQRTTPEFNQLGIQSSQNIGIEIVSERTNVNVDTLEEHYDDRNKEQARTTRQEHIDGLRF
jgi:hypothetical protein